MIWLNILIGAGAVQGLVLSAVLMRFAGDRADPALRWLSALVAAFSLMVFSDVLVQTGAIYEFPYIYSLFDFLIFWVGPLLYCYVLSMIGRPPWSWPTLILHLLPGLLLLAYLAPDFFLDTAARRALIVLNEQYVASAEIDPALLLAATIVLLYFIAALRQLQIYRRQLEDNYSATDRLKLQWLVWLLGYLALLWTCWMAFVVLRLKGGDLLGQLGIGIGIYLLGYLGLRQPRLWTLQRPAPVAAASPPEPAAKYQKSGVDRTTLSRNAQQLEQLMRTELPHLEPELKLADLATRLGISAHELSQTLNVELQLSFFDYINALRVAEVQRCFADPAYNQSSILEIALASGFASKATFNATFKRITGKTPSAARLELRSAQPAV